MKCANCDRDAFYVYQITKTVSVLYCGKHLPNFLEARRRAGNLKTTQALKEEKETALSILETVPPSPTEEPAKPKSRKKKAKEPSEE